MFWLSSSSPNTDAKDGIDANSDIFNACDYTKRIPCRESILFFWEYYVAAQDTRREILIAITVVESDERSLAYKSRDEGGDSKRSERKEVL